MRFSSLPRALACAVAVAAVSACADRTPTSGTLPAAPAPDARATHFECRADVGRRTLECTASAPTNARGNLMVGGQDSYVKLRTTGVAFSDGVLSGNESVQNLLGQPMGTPDGTTPDPAGVRIFFVSGPTTTSGTGSVTVQNPDGVGTFTASGQPYFQYDGILGPGATSAEKPWRFQTDPGVATFSFGLLVSAALPHESGWISIYEPNPVLAPGQSTHVDGLVYSAVGGSLEGQAVTWASSDNAVATVSADGTVTGVALGTATLTATSGARSGTTRVTVADVDGALPEVTAFTIAPDPVNAGDSVTFSVTVTDAGTGVRSVSVNVRANGTAFPPINSGCLALAPSIGTRASGTFTCRAPIPTGTAPGTWRVVSIFVPDERGNLRQLTVTSLAAAGFPSQFTVADATPDVTAPVLTALTVDPTTVNAGDSVTVTATVTDAGSGVASVTPIFVEPALPFDNRRLSCTTTTPVAGTANSGTFTCRVAFPPGIRPGWWMLGQIRLQDRTGNVAFPNSVAPFFPTAVNVVSPVRDSTPPTLRGISMPATAAPGDSVTVTIGTADAGTGVAGVIVYFKSQQYVLLRTCDHSALVGGTAAFGTFQCRFALPAVSGTGTWTVLEVDLLDVTGNARYVLAGELQALGYPSTIVVTP